MRKLWVVLRTRGRAWDLTKQLREQPLWDEHARYLDQLTERGIIVLGGPLEGTGDAMLIFEAGNESTIHRILKDDPWSPTHQLETKSVTPWNVLLEAPAATAKK